MSDMNFKFLAFLFFAVILGGCTVTAVPSPTAPPMVANGRALVIGDISDEAAETILGTQPLADYLAAQMREYGITHGEVKIAPDLETMVLWMRNGQVDLYFDSPYPTLVISQETNAIPI
ncbi:MAG: PhnD/SsuA/transferrin family substrate-binding protein, partial [Candidatus Promineifilaceae bacterium]